MHHFVSISRVPGSFKDDRGIEILVRAREGLRRLSPEPEIAEIESGGEITLYHSPGSERFAADPDSRFLMLLSPAVYDETNGTKYDAKFLLAKIKEGGVQTFKPLAAPFGLCARIATGGPTLAVTDRCGLDHVYYWKGDGIAAAASSALLLGLIFGEPPDTGALGDFALIGYCVGLESMIENVRKLGPGEACWLQNGRAEVATYVPAVGHPEGNRLTGAEAARKGAEAMRATVEACIKAFPDCDLELSGGMDSRLVLAGIPANERRGHRLITLDDPTTNDARVAGDIARRLSMEHVCVKMNRLADIDPEEAVDVVRSASICRDHQANPIECGVQEWVRREIGSRPRLTGQNGEIARGFFYPTMPLAEKVTPQGIASLVRWRLMTNDPVKSGLLQVAFRDATIARATEEIVKIFSRYPDIWGYALDDFYLDFRMHRWSGIRFTGGGRNRVILAPFFHETYIAWAKSLHFEEKNGSRAFARTLEELDHALAQVPTDAGPTPHDFFSPGLAAASRRASVTVHQIVRKVSQRAFRITRSMHASNALLAAMLRGGIMKTIDFERLNRLNIFSPQTLEQIEAGKVTPDYFSLGFLIAVDGIQEFIKPISPKASRENQPSGMSAQTT